LTLITMRPTQNTLSYSEEGYAKHPRNYLCIVKVVVTELKENKLARVHERITNLRDDFLHKLSTRIIRENGTL